MQGQTAKEPVILKGIRDAAIRIAIRLALGEFQVRGPQENVLELESRVAWATVATELQNEGYVMVPLDRFVITTGVTPVDVTAMIEQDGTLFALVYRSYGETFTQVPLPEREVREQLGPIPE